MSTPVLLRRVRSHERVVAPGTGTPLRRNRDFMLLWSGQAASTLGTQIAYVSYPLLALALTNSAAHAGIVGFALSGARFVLQLPAGALVDRWNRKRVMVAADVGRGAALGSVGFAALFGTLTFPHLVLAAFIEGGLAVFFAPAEEAALKHVVPQDQVADAVAQNKAREYAAALVGPPLGGALFAAAWALPFFADALSYVVSLSTVLFVRKPLQEARFRERRHIVHEMAEGFAWVWSRPLLRSAAVYLASLNFVANAAVFSVIIVQRERGMSSAAVGSILAAAAAGGLAGATLAPRIRQILSPTMLILGLGWLWALLLPLMAIASNPLVDAAALALLWFLSPSVQSIIGGYRVALAPDRLLGRISSVSALIAGSAIPLGPLAAGLTADRWGEQASMLVLGTVALAVVLVATATSSLRHASAIVTRDVKMD